MDKAPDAFRTISEVADDLDIPAHVLRFWETRFVQIKPMKRSGGRRYYRPDDVHLLRGIRRLLYGEGYTIRGVQRILREHGIKAVQGIPEGESIVPASFAGPPFESENGGRGRIALHDADGDADEAFDEPDFE
ncbi:MAG TPA: MerR family transcriptional regulator, partial [Afipia sp.]